MSLGTRRCNTPKHTATLCNILQHTTRASGDDAATHCNTLQHSATLCNILQHTAHHTTRASADDAATRCNTLQQSATLYNILQHTATHRTAHDMSLRRRRQTRVFHVKQVSFTSNKSLSRQISVFGH